MTGTSRSRFRRGFSLFEALAVVIMVAIAIPPMAAIATARAESVSDAARRRAALHLAVGVTETILADSQSASARLGFEGFARADYLDAAADGLRARLARMSQDATELGVGYDVIIGPPLDTQAKAVAFNTTGALRLVSVTASWTSASGRPASLNLQTLVVNR